jgi:tetratricopeptide (TPR) repeat protein
MKKQISNLLVLLMFFGYSISYGQNISLAMNYVEQGEYEKAKSIYQKLYEKNSNKQDYLLGLADVFIQLEEFENAENLLTDYLKKPGTYPNILVELGYVYQIQNDTVKANLWYDKAVEEVKERSVFAYPTGRAFEKYSLVDYAIKSYEIANAEEPRINYSIQLAKLYGEKGDQKRMFDNYISLIEQNDKYFDVIQRNLNEYITNESDHESNVILKRLLIQKLQQSPKLLYNQILSWVFAQEEAYDKAFAQEKAIFKRTQFKNFIRLFNLAEVAEEAFAYDNALEIYDFIENESQNKITQLEAIESQLKVRLDKEEKAVDIKKRFEDYLTNFGYNAQSVGIQLLYAEFMAFQEEDYQEALSVLNEAMNFEINPFQKASVQMLIADIFVTQEQFNNALIKYSLVSKQVKNTPLAQMAKYKTAMTSYYKGDFDWALTQLDVLKRATTQTIANDAIEMALFIKQGKSDIDSTQFALRQMAKADLMIYQSKPQKALVKLDSLINDSDNYHIIDKALYKKAQVLEDMNLYQEAARFYEQLIAQHPESIVIDNALFALANLQVNKLGLPEKAQENLEILIFNHQDSIFFVEGRKLYRKLRQDQNIE